MYESSDINFPDIPSHTNEEIQQKLESGDYFAISFEWLKFVSHLRNLFCAIVPEANFFKTIDADFLTFLRALILKSAKLCHVILFLAKEDKFGEAIKIIFRCISEIDVKILWFIQENDLEKFKWYKAYSLKNDVKLLNKINENIEHRDGKKLVIEDRMLNSVNRYIKASNLTIDKINSAKKFRNHFDLISDIGFDETVYIGIQSLSSHAIHTTFTDLLFDHIKLENDRIVDINFENLRPDEKLVDQIIIWSFLILKSYINFGMQECDEKRTLLEYLTNSEDSFKKDLEIRIKKDFKENS